MNRDNGIKTLIMVGLGLLAFFVLCGTAALAAAWIFGFNPLGAVRLPGRESQPSAPAVDLQGIWQQNGFMAAGWADRYHFYPSGTYRFYPNEMACVEEKTGKSGTWQLQGAVLSLTTTRRQITRLQVYPCGLCKVMERSEVALEPPESEVLTVVDLGTQEGDIYPSITLGGVKYWKFSDDASRYGEEEFPE